MRSDRTSIPVVLLAISGLVSGACGSPRAPSTNTAESPAEEDTQPAPSPPALAPAAVEPSPQPAAATPPTANVDPPAPDGGQAAAGTPCGARGQPPCPMQGYMKTKVLPAMRAGGEALAVELARVAAWSPDPTWNDGPTGWRAVSEAGAAAARAGQRAGAQAACKKCHLAWQKRYRADFRARPLPAAGP